MREPQVHEDVERAEPRQEVVIGGVGDDAHAVADALGPDLGSHVPRRDQAAHQDEPDIRLDVAERAQQLPDALARVEVARDPHDHLPGLGDLRSKLLPAPGGTLTTPLNERYTFDTFVIGKSNELAAAAAHAVAEAPGKTYNPLFIYGATGLGKTHLMQAIAHTVLERHPDTRVLYLSAEQFINEVIESMRERTMPEFRRRYRNDVDLFLVDDIHFLEGKEMTQEEFFHTFNALFEAHKQIVLTSDRAPKEIPGLEERLISRFEWGMVADVGHPDLEHRIAILRKKAEQDHLELTIPDDVLRFIAEHVRSSVRELEGCIIKLLLFASLKNREVTIELARDALSDKIRQGDDGGSYGRPTPSIDRVQEVVARRWGVTPEGLRSKARTKTLTIPRQVAMYLARDMLGMQLVEIGQAFGGRDHSTVIHSVDKVERQMMRDRSFKERVELARQELSAA